MPPMPNVVFNAPYLLRTTRRFVEHAARLPGVKLGLISQEPEKKLPAELRASLAAYVQTKDALAPDEILRGCRKIGAKLGSVDRLLGALEELQVPLGQVRAELGIPGMTGEVAKNFRDKAQMKEVLQAHGLPCARHTRVQRADQVWAFANEVGYPMIVKPTSGSGSRNTFRVESEEQMKGVLDLGAPSAQAEMMLEEFVTGREYSFDSVFRNGRLQWFSCCHYFPRPLEVIENAWMQWCVIIPREADHPQYHDIRQVAEQSLRALGMDDGLSHMEWFRRPDGTLAISEVGARPPGAQFVTLISYAHDVDFYAAWARLMALGEFTPPTRPYAAGAAFLRAQGQGKKIEAIRGLDEVREQLGDLAVEVKLPPEGAKPATGYEGDGYVIVRHPETEVVEQALGKIVQTIRVELG